MSDKMIIAMLLAFSTLGAVISSSSLKDIFNNGHNTELGFVITDTEVRLTTSYPKSKAKKIHAFVRESLHLGDLPELSSVEIKDYKTPDGFLSMYIKSRDGYLRVKLNRRRNPAEAIEQVRMTTEGIKAILAEK